MTDPSLYEALHPKTSSAVKKTAEKDRFELALDESINECVDNLMKEEDPTKNNLISPKVRRKKLEQEVREDLDLTEFGQHVSNAVDIIRADGKRYLSQEEYNALVTSLGNLRNQLNNLDLNNLEDGSFKSTLQIPAEDRASILKIGIAKFSEKLLPESLSIFTFLATLDAEDPDYWYRLGLVAQEMERNDLALRAYSAVTELAPEFLGARIFAAQCHLNNKQREKAVAELAEIKNILKTTGKDENWDKYVTALENMVGQY